jgi:hypothetical protein
MSFDIYSLMLHNTTLPFSVAKFAIEGAGEGAVQTHTVCPAPPRLPGPHTASVSKIPFHINPFSLSRSSLSASSSQSSKSVNLCTSSPSSPALFASSSCAHSLFPNPFLLKQNLDFQPAPVVVKKTITDVITQPTSVIQPIPDLHHDKLHMPQNPHTTKSSPSITHLRKPRKP